MINVKRNSIKWRIFQYNIIAIVLQILLTIIIFNVAVRVYIEKDILGQLEKIAANTETTALQHGPNFFLMHINILLKIRKIIRMILISQVLKVSPIIPISKPIQVFPKIRKSKTVQAVKAIIAAITFLDII